MCGIVGFIDNQPKDLVSKMLETTSHRGPDHSGTWNEENVHFGHNRLTIIDLSESAHQPFCYDQYVITFNGEIYNYVELKQELLSLGYSFRTESDTEVILVSYKEWGEKCVEKFVGMWAFAVWNKETKTLFCSRDRFAIKPFYYIHKGDKFYFASEYKPLKLSPIFNSEINTSQVYRGMQMGWLGYKEETYFTCIKSLPNACNLTFKNGQIDVYKYWDIDFSLPPLKLSNEEKEEQFRKLFLDSVSIHMRSDVPVGACLSGGLDSSAIVSSIGHLFPEKTLKTFTIFYSNESGEVDERPWVQHVVDQNENIIPYYYQPTDDELEDALYQMIYYFDVPPAGSSPLSQYFLMKLAKKEGVKVVVDGQGADEYLAGYKHSMYRLITDYIKRANFIKVFRNYEAIKKNEDFKASDSIHFLGRTIASLFLNEQGYSKLEYKKGLTFIGKEKKTPFHLKTSNASDLNNQLYHLTFNTSLPNLLHNEDRNSMAFSLESRVPFLDHRLVEFVFRLNNEDKILNGRTKNILREGMNNIMPKPITNRKDKKGFVTPGEIKWLRGPLSHLVDNINPNTYHFFDSEAVKKEIMNYKNGDNSNAKLIWRLVTFSKWLEKV